jgi:hypothetical protein
MKRSIRIWLLLLLLLLLHQFENDEDEASQQGESQQLRLMHKQASGNCLIGAAKQSGMQLSTPHLPSHASLQQWEQAQSMLQQHDDENTDQENRTLNAPIFSDSSASVSNSPNQQINVTKTLDFSVASEIHKTSIPTSQIQSPQSNTQPLYAPNMFASLAKQSKSIVASRCSPLSSVNCSGLRSPGSSTPAPHQARITVPNAKKNSASIPLQSLYEEQTDDESDAGLASDDLCPRNNRPKPTQIIRQSRHESSAITPAAVADAQGASRISLNVSSSNKKKKSTSALAQENQTAGSTIVAFGSHKSLAVAKPSTNRSQLRTPMPQSKVNSNTKKSASSKDRSTQHAETSTAASSATVSSSDHNDVNALSTANSNTIQPKASVKQRLGYSSEQKKPHISASSSANKPQLQQRTIASGWNSSIKPSTNNKPASQIKQKSKSKTQPQPTTSLNEQHQIETIQHQERQPAAEQDAKSHALPNRTSRLIFAQPLHSPNLERASLNSAQINDAMSVYDATLADARRYLEEARLQSANKMQNSHHSCITPKSVSVSPAAHAIASASSPHPAVGQSVEPASSHVIERRSQSIDQRIANSICTDSSDVDIAAEHAQRWSERRRRSRSARRSGGSKNHTSHQRTNTGSSAHTDVEASAASAHRSTAAAPSPMSNPDQQSLQTNRDTESVANAFQSSIQSQSQARSQSPIISPDQQLNQAQQQEQNQTQQHQQQQQPNELMAQVGQLILTQMAQLWTQQNKQPQQQSQQHDSIANSTSSTSAQTNTAAALLSNNCQRNSASNSKSSSQSASRTPIYLRRRFDETDTETDRDELFQMTMPHLLPIHLQTSRRSSNRYSAFASNRPLSNTTSPITNTLNQEFIHQAATPINVNQRSLHCHQNDKASDFELDDAHLTQHSELDDSLSSAAAISTSHRSHRLSHNPNSDQFRTGDETDARSIAATTMSRHSNSTASSAGTSISRAQTATTHGNDLNIEPNNDMQNRNQDPNLYAISNQNQTQIPPNSYYTKPPSASILSDDIDSDNEIEDALAKKYGIRRQASANK